MPKVKRFRNPQKSAPQPQCHGPLTQAPTHSVPAMNPEISSPPSDSTQAPEVPTGNVPLSHVSASEVPQEDETTRRHVGRESTQCWSVEAIDSEETIKKIKVKVRGVNSLPRELHIIVNFDDQGQAIGEAQALLVGFLGTLAADCKLFPMDYDRWFGPSGVPKTYFDDCFETILKPQFYFKINEAGAKRYCKLSMGRQWAANRQSLWNEFNDPTKTRDEIIKNMPIGIDKNQWARFVHFHHKPSTLVQCSFSTLMLIHEKEGHYQLGLQELVWNHLVGNKFQDSLLEQNVLELVLEVHDIVVEVLIFVDF
ncbi:hypothetical protein HKD37_15G043747 [Glycine soja]